jgi:hypothetical protein
MGDVFDEIQPEQPAGDVFDQIQPEPVKPVDTGGDFGFGLSDYETNALKHFGVSLASGSLKGSAAALHTIRGLANLTGRLLGQDVESPEWKNAKRITDYAGKFDELAARLDKYNEQTGASKVSTIPGQVIGQLPAGVLQWEGNIPLAATQGFEQAKEEGKGTVEALGAGTKAGIERAILGKALKVLGRVENAVVRRGGSAVALGGASALHGGTLEDILTQAGVGAVISGKTRPERPNEVRPVTPQPPETPAPLGNEKPPENDYVKFEGIQEGSPEDGIPDMKLYTLKQDIPGHPTGSTLAEETLRAAGVKLPETGAVSVPPRGPGPSGNVPETGKFPIQETGGKQETVTPSPINKWVTIDEALAAENLLKPLTPGSPESLRATEIRNQYLPPQKPPAVPPVVAPGMPEPPKPPRRLSLTQAKKQGHSIPNMLGWTDAQRMDFNKSVTGKTSMKGMNVQEARLVVEGMQAEAAKAGIDLSERPEPVGISEELISALQKSKPNVTELQEPHPSLWRKIVYEAKKTVRERVWGLERAPFRFFDALDSKNPNGPWKRLVWGPLSEKSALARKFALDDQKNLADFLNTAMGGNWEKLWIPEKIEGVKEKYSPSEKMYLTIQGMNSGAREVMLSFISEPELVAIEKSLTPQERSIIDYAVKNTDALTSPLFNAALSAGWKPSELKREFPYLPIQYLSSKTNPDFIDALAEVSTGGSMSPESRMLMTRQKGATGKVNMDLIGLLMNNSTRVHRFIQMAPFAKGMSGLMSNAKFRTELDNRTFGQGSKILTEFVKGKIRGGAEEKQIQNGVEKLFAWTRRKGTAFAAARNILMTMKQPLSFFTAMANEPRYLPYAAKEVGKLFSSIDVYKTLNNEVENQSLAMKDRAEGRDVRRLFKEKDIQKTLQRRLDHKSMNFYGSVDRTTANLVWKITHDYAFDKLFRGDEKQATQYADNAVIKTQSLMHKEDLPMLYRGGELAKQVAVFTRETSTLGNAWVYDVYGAKIHGEIGWGKFAYRVAVGQIIPGLLLGAISRGHVQKDWKEVATDLAIYEAGPTIIGAALINRLLTGLDHGFISATAWDGLLGAYQQAKKLPQWDEMDDDEKAKTVRLLLKKSAITIGGVTGYPSAQDVRTLEGAYDLWMQNTQDPRRLIWSEYALKRGEGKPPQEGR